MESIKIALVTDNREYGRALGMGLLNVCRTLVIHLFDKEGFLSGMYKFYEKNASGVFSQQFDLILWDGEEIKEFYGENMVFMAEKPYMCHKDFSGRKFCVYKYSCAQSFVADIFEIYSSLTGVFPANVFSGGTRLLAFASWAGGTGCSTIAMMVSRELCRFYGKRVLYLSFESIESTENFIGSYSGSKPVGQYLYNLFKDKGKKPFIESYIIRDEFGVEAFAPTKGRNPLKDMGEREFCVFLESIAGSGRYDAVIMDLGNCLDEVNLTCLEVAERVCMVTVSENNKYREAQYMQYLICRCGEAAADKMTKVENMCAGKTQGGFENGEGEREEDEAAFLKTSIYIGKERYFTDENKVNRVSLEGDFSQKISALAALLMEPL